MNDAYTHTHDTCFCGEYGNDPAFAVVAIQKNSDLGVKFKEGRSCAVPPVFSLISMFAVF